MNLWFFLLQQLLLLLIFPLQADASSSTTRPTPSPTSKTTASSTSKTAPSPPTRPAPSPTSRTPPPTSKPTPSPISRNTAPTSRPTSPPTPRAPLSPTFKPAHKPTPPCTGHRSLHSGWCVSGQPWGLKGGGPHEETILQLDGNDDLEENQSIGQGQPKKLKLSKETEMSKFLEDVPIHLQFYVGNLRKENAAVVLKNHFVCIRETKEDQHNLLPIDPKNMILVKHIKCKTKQGLDSHVWCCLKCNSYAEVIIKNLQTIQTLEDSEIKSMKKACKHTIATEILDFDKEFDQKNEKKENVTVLKSEKPHIAAAMDGQGSYGIIMYNSARHAKSGKCHWPHNKYENCSHAKVWTKEKGKELISNAKGTIISNQNEPIVDGNEEPEDDMKKYETPIYGKLKWPHDANTQEVFREIEKERFSKLKNLVPTYLPKLKCKHRNKFKSDDPIKNEWIMSRNVRIFHIGLIEEMERIIYYRPSEGTCNCRQSYTGEEDMLLVARLSVYHRKGIDQVCDLMTYPLLSHCTNRFGRNSGLRNAHYELVDDLQRLWGKAESDVIPWESFRIGLWKFWENVLDLDLKTLYTCPECGQKPSTLVADGITLGIQIQRLGECKLPLYVPYESPQILKGTPYKKRVFVKFYFNRQIIRKACLSNIWPETMNMKKKDTGADLVAKFIDHMKTKEDTPSSSSLKLLTNISNKTSSTNLFPVIDQHILEELQQYLQGDMKKNFCSGLSNVWLHQELLKKYPVITCIVKKLATLSGMLEKPVSDLILALLNHTMKCYENSATRSEEMYTKNYTKEIVTQVYPNFPLIYQRARYDKECKSQDEEAWRDLCQKSFPESCRMSPGLFLLTCTCSNKIVYGFSFMTVNESPGMIFDIFQTRFPRDYRPTIVYDASCKAKEYGLNRETRDWMNIEIVTDPFHQPNHTNCSDSFKSTSYQNMNDLNCEAAEQFNSLLRTMHPNFAMMGVEHYMTAMKIYIAYRNDLARKLQLAKK